MPNNELSVNEGAIAPWATARTQYFSRMLDAVGAEHGINLDTPWAKLSKSARELFLYGNKGKEVTVRYKNRYGRQRSFAIEV